MFYSRIMTDYCWGYFKLVYRNWKNCRHGKESRVSWRMRVKCWPKSEMCTLCTLQGLDISGSATRTALLTRQAADTHLVPGWLGSWSTGTHLHHEQQRVVTFTEKQCNSYSPRRGGDSSVVRAPDSWLKGRGFESLLERRENFLLQGRLSVLTLISVSVPPPCYHSST